MDKNMKKRFKDEMARQGISEKHLLISILELIGERGTYDKQKGNFSKMISGDRDFPAKYIKAIEKILKRPIVYFLEGSLEEQSVPYQPNNFEFFAFKNEYAIFEKIDTLTDASGNSILYHYDEYERTLIDYIIQYRAVEGIRFLVDKHDLHYDLQFGIKTNDDHCYWIVNHCEERLAKMLIEQHEDDLFMRVFNPFILLSQYALHNYYRTNIFFYKETILDNIILSDKLISCICRKEKKEIRSLNQGYTLKYNFSEVDVVCPLLSPVLERLITTYTEDNKEKILRLLKYSIDVNNEIISYLAEKNKEKQFSNLQISEEGYGVVLDEWIIIGNLVVYKNVINPELPRDIKDLLHTLETQRMKIGSLDDNEIIVYEKYLMSRHVDNKNMYDMYRLMNEQDVSIIPRLYETKEETDKFDYIKGNICNPWTLSQEQLSQVVSALKSIHDACKMKLQGKVYLHGKNFEDSFVFNKDSLAGIIHWEDCRVGEIEDDLIVLVEQVCQLKIVNEWDYEGAFAKIKTILKEYGNRGASEGFGDKMLRHFIKEREGLNKEEREYKTRFINVKNAETFTEYYLNELNSL